MEVVSTKTYSKFQMPVIFMGLSFPNLLLYNFVKLQYLKYRIPPNCSIPPIVAPPFLGPLNMLFHELIFFV